MLFKSSKVKVVSTGFSQLCPNHIRPFIPSCSAVYEALHEVLALVIASPFTFKSILACTINYLVTLVGVHILSI